MADVRRIAYDALILPEDDHPLSSKDVLDKYSYLDSQDRSFLKRLIEGVTERRITLDYVIGLYSSVPVRDMKKQIRTLLRLGTCQLLYMDKVAQFAAVNETVRIARKIGFGSLSGFVNGVLRSISKNRDDIPWPDRDKDMIRHYSVVYSCPEWIVSRLIEEQGEENAVSLLKLSVSVRPVTARVNLSRAAADEEASKGYAAGSDVLPYALVLGQYDNITSIPSFAEGRICIQDISSMLVCHIAGIRQTDTVLDLCAAPGGKSLHAADLATCGRVISCDVSEAKTEKIAENVERCGFLNIEINTGDATMYNDAFDGIADVVIADVPCSGLGVMGRKNDIKYNLKEEAIVALVPLQQKILANAARYVKPGGILMFSTCTCSNDENIGNLRFLTEECRLTPVGFYDELPESLRDDTAREGYITLYGRDMLTDGFFIAKLRK